MKQISLLGATQKPSFNILIHILLVIKEKPELKAKIFLNRKTKQLSIAISRKKIKDIIKKKKSDPKNLIFGESNLEF